MGAAMLRYTRRKACVHRYIMNHCWSNCCVILPLIGLMAAVDANGDDGVCREMVGAEEVEVEAELVVRG